MENFPDQQEIISKIKSVISSEKEFIPLHEPQFSGNESKYLKDCIDTGWVSSVGKYVDTFEEKLTEYTGTKKAVAIVNGTAALHICLLLSGVEENDEVLIPALSFVATANAVSYLKAIPHFIDSDYSTLGVNADKLALYLRSVTIQKSGECYNKLTGRRIKAVVPMHTFGHPVDLDPLVETAKEFHIELVEDAAESLGSFYKGAHTGTFGKISSLSFNGNKVITTGGGGAIITNDEKLGKLAKHITTTAKMPHKWEFYHDMIGFNYRMPNLNAALGCAQMENLPLFLAKKRILAEKYQSAFSGFLGAKIFREPDFGKSNYWLNILQLDLPDLERRNQILENLNNAGIMARPAWNLLHTLPMFSEFPRMDLMVAEDLEKRIINIPSSANLVN